MTVQQIKDIAKQAQIPTGKLRKAELIHAIQVSEGNAPCFDTGIEHCGLTECLWYGDCQK